MSLDAADTSVRATTPPSRVQDLIIGSGPGGAITATLLAEHGRETLLLEDGPYLELESCAPFSLEEMITKYRCGGLTPAVGNPKVAYVEGRCVGGGSEINSGLYHHTPPEILDRWAREFALKDSSPNDLAPFYQANEDDLSVCTTPGPTPLASRMLACGAERLGWRALEVPRWFRYDDTRGPDGVPRGTRQSMTKTFIPRALAAGCRLLPNTRATRLTRQGKLWRVEVRTAGGVTHIEAENVFVCAGAIQTPALLLRSGIGQNIGRSLALHPTVKFAARFPEEINHEELGVPVHQVKEFSPRLSFGCSISSIPHLALALLDHPGHERTLASQWRHMAIYYGMIAGGNTGAIRVLPGFDEPLVSYRLAPDDLRDLALCLRRLAEMLLAAGAVELLGSVSGMPPIRTRDDLSLIPASLPPSRTNLMTIHLFSSCPMGEQRDRCAANSFGEVHGVPGLHIHDASLICTAPGVNPQGTIMAFARRNTLRFLGEL